MRRYRSLPWSQRARSISSFWLLAVAVVTPVLADDVYLANGEVFEDVIVTVTERHVVIELPIGRLKLPSEQVERIEQKTTPLEEFRERREDLLRDPSSEPEEWVRLIRWARVNGLERDARESALLLSRIAPETPELSPLLESMGFVLEGSHGWVRFEEAMKLRGLVRDSGEWVTRAEARERQTKRAEARARERELRLAELRERREREERIASSSAQAAGAGGTSDNDVAMASVQLAREVVAAQAGQTIARAGVFAPFQPVFIPPTVLSGGRGVLVGDARSDRGSQLPPGYTTIRQDLKALSQRQPGSIIPLSSFQKHVQNPE